MHRYGSIVCDVAADWLDARLRISRDGYWTGAFTGLADLLCVGPWTNAPWNIIGMFGALKKRGIAPEPEAERFAPPTQFGAMCGQAFGAPLNGSVFQLTRGCRATNVSPATPKPVLWQPAEEQLAQGWADT